MDSADSAMTASSRSQRRFARKDYWTQLRICRLFVMIGLAGLVALNFADVQTTHLLLEHQSSGAREANPLAFLAINSGALLVVKLAVLSGLSVFAWLSRKRLDVARVAILWFGVGAYSTAVIGNILDLRLLSG